MYLFVCHTMYNFQATRSCDQPHNLVIVVVLFGCQIHFICLKVITLDILAFFGNKWRKQIFADKCDQWQWLLPQYSCAPYAKKSLLFIPYFCCCHNSPLKIQENTKCATYYLMKEMLVTFKVLFHFSATIFRSF